MPSVPGFIIGGGSAAPSTETTYTFSSSTGVTLVNGSVGGTAAVTGGVLRCTVPATPSASYYGGTLAAPYGEVPAPLGTTARQPLHWRARVRVAAVPIGTIAYFLAVSAGGNHRAGIFLVGDGSGRSEYNSAPQGYGSAGWSAGVVPVDGTGWLEIEICGSVGTYRYGTGTATTQPTTWTTHATVTLPTIDAYTKVRLIGASNSPPGSALSVDFDDLTLETL